MTGPAGNSEHSDGRAPETAEGVRDFARLRELLVGREQQDIADLRRNIRDVALSAENVGKHLPEAIALRAGQDDQLARALAPTLEGAFTESVHRNPHTIAQAIYPTLGPAIRKAIAEAIGGIVAGINRALEESFSVRGMRWRIEAWRSGVPYAQIVMKHALVYRVEQAYLIHAETGLLLSHVHAPDLAAPDADVISGMLTAIRDFVGDSFRASTDGGLRTFSVGDVTVIVEAGPRALLAAVVRGQHPTALLERLQQTLELLHLHFAGPLAHFSGDNAPFDTAKPILAECLETVVDTAKRTHRGLVPRIAWITVGLVVLAVGVFAFMAQRRWNRALTAMRAEPGYVVLSSGRGLRAWHVQGLRDPLARVPSQILAAHGIDSTRVRAAWAPYVSAEPEIVLRRAGRVLAAPTGVQMQFRADTLILTGTASTDWLDRASARVLGIAGISAVVDSGVAPTLPPAAQLSADSIRVTHVLFDVGSARLSEAAQTTLRNLSASLGVIEGAIGEQWHVEISITGRTDTTGSQELNRTLSDVRARNATEFLAREGMGTAQPVTQGVGTTNPLAAPTLEERARINRSVSFAVRVRRNSIREGRSQ